MALAGSGSEPVCPWLNKIAPRTKPVTIRAVKLALIQVRANSADSQSSLDSPCLPSSHSLFGFTLQEYGPHFFHAEMRNRDFYILEKLRTNWKRGAFSAALF